MGDSSGNQVALGVDISADLLLINQLSGQGWVNYAGSGSASGNSVSGAYQGDYIDDNNGQLYCFDLDNDGFCDDNSEVQTTEEFILSW